MAPSALLVVIADRVLDLKSGQAKLGGNHGDGLSGTEQPEYVFEARTTVGERRLAEAAPYVGNDLGVLEAR